MGDLSRNHIIPTGIKYLNTLIENVKGLKEIYAEDYKSHAKEQMLLIERISSHIAEINSGVNKMIEERKKANAIEDDYKKSLAYCNAVKPVETIRYCDKLELLVAIPSVLGQIQELLFLH